MFSAAKLHFAMENAPPDRQSRSIRLQSCGRLNAKFVSGSFFDRLKGVPHSTPFHESHLIFRFNSHLAEMDFSNRNMILMRLRQSQLFHQNRQKLWHALESFHRMCIAARIEATARFLRDAIQQ